MSEDRLLDKTVRVNLLLDFYGSLLTEKQQLFLTYYYQDNFSLGEIADTAQISRQAVFEHLKRAEATLEEYEQKLQLLSKFERRNRIAAEMKQLSDRLEPALGSELHNLLRRLAAID